MPCINLLNSRGGTRSFDFDITYFYPEFARFAHFLPIFGQKMGKNGQKTGERNRTLAKQGETKSFAKF